MFKKYDAEINTVLSEKPQGTDWGKQLEFHRIMLGRIRHERLIHLLVTLFVGLAMTVVSLVAIAISQFTLLFLSIALLLLFFAYLVHYRFLENTTQKWYLLEDRIIKILR